MRECREIVAVESGLIRSAVLHDVAHAQRTPRRLAIESITTNETCDPTHYSMLAGRHAPSVIRSRGSDRVCLERDAARRCASSSAV